ncbi:ABC transporter substrate-binding protein [Tissierella praeacuta]|uniref:ABC transporter substrate-binding protein n=1 Tax=Tissierella praeacuta TaxID=43131 RepID=UPI0028AEC242|nr:ABC transporter substrate-binding protein [Tissierella praeacuta]
MKKSILIVLMVCLVAGMFTGCTSKNTSKDSDLTKVVISEMRGESWIPVYAAEMLGYFKEEGLDTEWVVFKDGPIAFQGMHAGDSQFCMLSTEPVLRAFEEGLESKIIISTVKNKQYIFAGSSEITSVEQLKGKAIFAGMPGSAPYSFVLSALEEAGLSENDVEWINMEYGAALAALEQGSIAASFFDGIHINELKNIDANILINTSDPAQHEALYGSKYYESQMVTVTKEFAEKNPETIQKFVNAVIKAMAWQAEHTDEELAKLVSPMFEDRDLVEIVGILRGSLSNDGFFSEEGYNAIESFCLDQGIIKNPIGYENIIDMSYVNNARKSLEN